MSDKLERRDYAEVELSIETRADGPPRLVGHAAVFNRWSENLGGFRERIAPGAFTKTIEENDVVGLYNHDRSKLLGRTPDTMRLSEDKRGLKFEIDLADTTVARDVAEDVRAGNLKGNSFGFITVGEEWREPEKEGKLAERTLTEVRLIDVGPVVFPAYPQTDVAVRSLESFISSREEPGDQSSGLNMKRRHLDLLAAERGM